MHFGPFEEKPVGSGVSMSRCIAALFAGTYSYALVLAARNVGPTTIMGWPFACLGIVIVLAVPLQALFKSLQKWIATPQGKAVIQTMIEKFASAQMPGGTSVTTATTVAPATDTHSNVGS